MNRNGRLTWRNTSDITAPDVTLEQSARNLVTITVEHPAFGAYVTTRVITEAPECPDQDAHWRLDEALARMDDANERDETVARLEQRLTEAECHDCVRDTAVIETVRPMRAEDITDEMVERARVFMYDTWNDVLDSYEARLILTAALTPEPQRPEGAEALTGLINDAMRAQGWKDDYATLADHLAEQGVRVQEQQ